LKSILAATLTLCTVTLCGAQSPSPTAAAKHYRLTVVLSDAQDKSAAQSFVVDVPVSADHTGQAEMNLVSGPTDQAENAVRQTFKCTGVHASQTGLAAKISYVMDSVSPEPVPGSSEHLVSHFVFEKQIDLPLAVATAITDTKSLKPLQPLGNAQGEPTRRPAPLQITVTATEL
jgi:hypothetical protein